MFGPFVTLLRLQLRILGNNRPACVVLICLIVAPLIPLPRSQLSVAGTCYVVYWHEDAWIQRLKSELEQRAEDGPPIEIVPVHRFVDEDDVIRYPPGTHSIQIRTPEGTRDHWVIWCWYSGSDPSVLDEPAAWFWEVTRDHFGDALPFEVKYSSLSTQIAPPFNLTNSWLSSLRRITPWSVALWLALVFCACYLPALSLGQQHESQAIVSLATTPVGWSGAVLATMLFYGVATILVAALVAQRVQNGLALLPLVLLATIAYLGVGLCIGCWTRSTASASGGVILYGLVSGAIAAGSYFTWSPLATVLRAFSVEASLFDYLRESNGQYKLVGMAGLLLSAILWQILALVGCWMRRHRGI